MNQCRTCDAPLPEGVRYCPNCGAAATGTNTPHIQDTITNLNQANSDTRSPYMNAYQSPTGQPQNYGQSNSQDYTSNPNIGTPYVNHSQSPSGQPPYYRPSEVPYYNNYQGYGVPNPNTSQGSDRKSITALILGILSIVLQCLYGISIIIGIIGLVFGVQAQNENRPAYPQIKPSASYRTARAGIICSIIGIILSFFWLLILLFDSIS